MPWELTDSVGSYPCSHAVCETCAKQWWAKQEQQQQEAEDELQEDILPEEWFQCAVCCTLTGEEAAEGLQIRPLMNIVDMI